MAERRPPIAWLVAGLPGSGKSTFGRALARRTGAAILDQDTLTNPLMARIGALVGAGDDLDHPQLRGETRHARYECLWNAAAENVLIGNSVVLIAPFTTEVRDHNAFAELRRKLQPSRVFLIWMELRPDVALARRRLRNLPRDAFAPTEPAPPAEHPVIRYIGVDGDADTAGEADRVARLTFPDQGDQSRP